jgi:peptidoglycan/LPS O-acetylase OafA/YrhL
VFYLTVGSIVREPNLSDTSAITAEVFAIFTYTANFFAGYRGATALGWHWSLAAEEQFYFLFPFFILLTKNDGQRAKVTLFFIALLTFVVRPFGSNWFGQPTAAMYLPQFRNDALAYGFLAYLMTKQTWFNQINPQIVTANKFLRPLTMTILVGIVALAPQLALSYNVAIPIIGLSSCLLVMLAIWCDKSFVGFQPIQKLLNWIGLRSYGIYLLHIPMVRLIQHIESMYEPMSGKLSYPVHLAITLVSIAGIVEFSYRAIEKPLMKRGTIWSNSILEKLNNT